MPRVLFGVPTVSLVHILIFFVAADFLDLDAVAPVHLANGAAVVDRKGDAAGRKLAQEIFLCDEVLPVIPRAAHQQPRERDVMRFLGLGPRSARRCGTRHQARRKANQQ